ncbi:MAG TPA: cardiolipin synthase [Verrucomicrobiales bacterium]|nr:cardiolipin synthase [Verrucomicrobiales bacterium]
MVIPEVVWGALLLLLHGGGLLSAVHALVRVRTSQGTIAWCIGLVSFPLLSLPLYWVFGRRNFQEYTQSIRQVLAEHPKWEARVWECLGPYLDPPCAADPDLQTFEKLTVDRFTSGNAVDLLVDGDATFAAIFDALERAEDYVLFQFFIVRHDALGQRVAKVLRRKASEGVRVYVLYDEIGSKDLSAHYLHELRRAGIQVSAFGSAQGSLGGLRINFRNHRKTVVVDGRAAFVGGHNVGDEYLGKSLMFGHWRDTHVRVEGPAVQMIQATFVADWYWATREPLGPLRWESRRAEGADLAVLPLATGAGDDREACTLFFLNAIQMAKKRLWIASPYFVPDEAVLYALELAAVRGVDVRILIPAKSDHLMVYLAAFSYMKEVGEVGVKIFRYSDGFLHQKVLVVDDELAAVGTANLDNRSLRLNFEMTVLVADRGFAGRVAEMLERDFSRSELEPPDSLEQRGVLFRFAVHVCRLFAPIL